MNLQREIRNEGKASIKYPIHNVKLKRREDETEQTVKFGIMGEEEDLEEEEFEAIPDEPWLA